MKCINYVLVFLIVTINFSVAQTEKIDSLLSALEKQKQTCTATCDSDTNIANTLNLLAWEFSPVDASRSLEYAGRALLIAQQSKNKMTISNSYHQLGWANYVLGNFKPALENTRQAIQLREEAGSWTAANSLNNLGVIYKEQGMYSLALDCYFKSLKIKEKANDKKGIASSLSNIGEIYRNMKDPQKALEYFEKGLAIRKEIKDLKGGANVMCNKATVFYDQKEYDRALENYFAAIEIYEEAGITKGIMLAGIYHNIGIIYVERDQFKEADHYLSKALQLRKAINHKAGIATSLLSFGNLMSRQKKYGEAERNYLDALTLAKEIGHMEWLRSVHRDLAELYKVTGKHEKALNHYKHFIIYRDSLTNEENTKKLVQTQMQYEFDKKEAESKARQEKKDALARETLKQQKLQRNYFIVGFILVLLLAAFILFSLLQKRKANLLLEEKNKLIEQQKHTVEEKQKEILDSIRYAHRIQRALISSELYVKKQLERLHPNR